MRTLSKNGGFELAGSGIAGASMKSGPSHSQIALAKGQEVKRAIFYFAQQQFGTSNVRFGFTQPGSKGEELNLSISCPRCPQERTSASASRITSRDFVNEPSVSQYLLDLTCICGLGRTTGDADWGRYKVAGLDHPAASRAVPTSVFGTRLVPENGRPGPFVPHKSTLCTAVAGSAMCHPHFRSAYSTDHPLAAA